MDGSSAEDRPDQDDGHAGERSAQPAAADRSGSAQEEPEDPEGDVVLHSIGDDEELPWCIGVSAAR